MSDAEIVEGTADDYHADAGVESPSLSRSIIHLLCTSSPAHAAAAHPKLNPNLERKEESKFDVGNAAHGLILEGVDLIEELDFPDWRSNAAKAARAASRADGRLPLLVHQARDVRAMVTAVLTKVPRFDAHPPLLTAGQPERILRWRENGVDCRALLDWCRDDMVAIDDLKTTGGSASPERWSRNAFFDKGYDIQAAWYLRGLRALGARRPRFRFIVAETSAPFCVSVFEASQAVLDVADAKIDFALGLWKKCLAENHFPGYPEKVGTIELLPWIESQWAEREEREAA